MANGLFHQSAKTKELIHGKGATLLFLPPYAPDLNPSENDFANLKRARGYNKQKTLDDTIKSYQ